MTRLPGCAAQAAAREGLGRRGNRCAVKSTMGQAFPPTPFTGSLIHDDG